jgi:site-specific DNA recombinase
MLKYFIYCRKSTEDEDRQILSIDAQISELNSIARANGLVVAETFTESKSAKEPGREVFNAMLRRLERGEANAILTWKLDRLARNFDDGGKIIGMLQRGTIQEIRAFEKVYLPSDNVLMIAVEFGMANQYIRDLSMNIRRGIREKIRRGVFHGRAPLGYINEPRLRTIEPDPELFPKIKRILEMFATGEYSLTAIQREMAAVAIPRRQYKSKLEGPLPLSSIGNLFRCPFYYGVFLHKGELHQGTHLPMVSKKTWDAIQAALVTVGKGRKQRTQKGFRFLNFATCGSCGYCITGERHRKKSGREYHYYRCTHKNKKQHCDGRAFIRDAAFEAEVKRNTFTASIPDEWFEKFSARIETWEAEASNDKQAEIERIKAELAKVKSKIDRLNNAFANGSLEIDEFKELKNPLIPIKTGLEQKLAELEHSKANRLEPLKNFIFEANMAQKWAKEENWQEMRAYLKKHGSNRILRAQTLTVTFKKPASLLAETVLDVQRTNELSSQCSKWWRRRELNPRPCQTNQPRLHA